LYALDVLYKMQTTAFPLAGDEERRMYKGKLTQVKGLCPCLSEKGQKKSRSMAYYPSRQIY
jgi:hypothetical protein